MDIASVSGIASLAINTNSANNAEAVNVSVLNKALDMQVLGVAPLIQSIAQSPQPGALGQYVDVMA